MAAWWQPDTDRKTSKDGKQFDPEHQLTPDEEKKYRHPRNLGGQKRKQEVNNHHPILMNQKSAPVILLACVLALLTSCTTSTPVYSDGSYGGKTIARTASLQGDQWPELVRPPSDIVQARARPDESLPIKGYALFVSAIQGTAYTAIYAVSIPGRLLAGAGAGGGGGCY